jgi:hypothetical protein
MTSAAEIIRRAESLGVQIETDGKDLLLRPAKKCPPDFVEELRQQKGEIVSWLSNPRPGFGATPPDNLPLNPVEPHPSPVNRELMINYLLRQTGNVPCRLGKWIVQRENSYYDSHGKRWDCGILCYSAARDAASWQLRRSEAEVLELLTGINTAMEKLRKCGP